MANIDKMVANGVTYNLQMDRILFTTVEPTEDNLTDGLIVVILEAEPTLKYEGYLYLIKAA